MNKGQWEIQYITKLPVFVCTYSTCSMLSSFSSHYSKLFQTSCAFSVTNFPVKNCALRLFYIKLECCFSSDVNRKDSEPNKAGSAHFGEEDKDRTSLSCTRIHKGAVPSIFLNIVKVTGPVNVKESSNSLLLHLQYIHLLSHWKKTKTFSNVEQNQMFPYNSK